MCCLNDFALPPKKLTGGVKKKYAAYNYVYQSQYKAIFSPQHRGDVAV
jgi:hypothetical protein